MDLLQALAAGETIDASVALVCAHPDDEVLGLGSRLGRCRALTIIHLTDGAPRDMVDARREGFERWQDYAAARRAELARALEALGAGTARTICYEAPDQEAILHCAGIARKLEADLAGAAAVITHPYEHGHPDHDAAALAVAHACGRLRRRGSPARYEFASYHMRDGRPVLGAFWADPSVPEIELRLTPEELEIKRAAMDCFDTQKALGGRFPLSPERVRAAPDYDFAAPAPPGEAVYERWGIAMTLARWRREADAAMRRVAEAPCPSTVLSVAYPFAPVTADPIGGAEQVLSMLDRALVARGHRSVVIAVEGSEVAGELVPVPPIAGEIAPDQRDRIHVVLRERIEAVLMHLQLRCRAHARAGLPRLPATSGTARAGDVAPAAGLLPTDGADALAARDLAAHGLGEPGGDGACRGGAGPADPQRRANTGGAGPKAEVRAGPRAYLPGEGVR